MLFSAGLFPASTCCDSCERFDFKEFLSVLNNLLLVFCKESIACCPEVHDAGYSCNGMIFGECQIHITCGLIFSLESFFVFLCDFEWQTFSSRS